jgi:glycosyltransferase involved in cell wall biosynthesis
VNLEKPLPQTSVIIPAYNCAAFLPETLKSVFAQTCSDFEVILIDDGSTDDIGAAIEPYLGRIKYIRQQNKGLPGARNTGIRAAQGDFIALLDADDSWAPEKLERQLPRFADSEVGIVYSDFSVRYADGRFQHSYLVDRPLASEGHILEKYIRSRFLFPSTMLIRRECFDEFGGFDEEMLACEDIELFARICSRWKAALVNTPLAIRYEGSHNITANSGRMNQYTILALKKILQKEPDLPVSTQKVLHEELGRQHFWRGYEAFGVGNSVQARTSLFEAIRYDANYLRSGSVLIAASFLPGSAREFLRRFKRTAKIDSPKR